MKQPGDRSGVLGRVHSASRLSVLHALLGVALACLSLACEDGSPVVILGDLPRAPIAGSGAGESTVSDDFAEHARMEYDLFERWRKEAACMELAPVCGANGTTYPNACKAAEAGARVARPGEC